MQTFYKKCKATNYRHLCVICECTVLDQNSMKGYLMTIDGIK